jgi:hypothetical protein
MKTIKIPAKQEQISFSKVWEEVIFPQASWRTTLVHTRAALELDDKIGKANGELVITDSEHELLQAAMQLPGMQVGPPPMLRFYMRCLEAVQNAATA